MKYWHGLPIEQRREVVRSIMKLQLLPKLPAKWKGNSRIIVEFIV
jgi:hypothetical protein